MASPAQIAANRANALKSTGPRTAAGKLRASMNPLKHGLAAATLVLPHEDNIAYQEMRWSLYSQYQPATPQECMLVDQLASAWWRTLRVRQVETDMLDLQIQTLKNKYPDKKASPKSDRQALAVRFVTESEKDFNNFLRYDANIERAFYRALNHLERLQAARLRREERQADTYAEISPEPPGPRRVPVHEPIHRTPTSNPESQPSANDADPVTPVTETKREPARQRIGFVPQPAVSACVMPATNDRFEVDRRVKGKISG